MSIAESFASAELLSKSYYQAAEKAASFGGSNSTPLSTYSGYSSIATSGPFSPDVSNAARQYAVSKTGIVHTSLRPICVKVADLAFKVGEKTKTKPKTRGGKMVTKSLSSSLIQKTPASFHKALAEGMEVLQQHDILDVLENPNPIMSGWAMKYCTAFSIEATGRSFWWIDDQRPAGGRLMLWYLPSTWVTPIATPENPFAAWEILPLGLDTSKAVTLPSEAIIPFSMPDPANPTLSFSPVQAQSRPINTDDEIQKTQYATMVNGHRPGLVLTAGRLETPPGMTWQGPRPVLTSEQRKQLIETIRLANAGSNHSGDPIIIDGMIESVTPFTRTPHELDFTNGSKLTKDRIMQGIGTNPIVAGQIEGANKASSIVASENFFELVVNPLVSLMSDAITKHLTPLYGDDGDPTNGGLFIWIEKAVAFDEELKLSKLDLAMAGQAITKNELREALDMKPLDDKRGEEWAGPPPREVPAGNANNGDSQPPAGQSKKRKRKT